MVQWAHSVHSHRFDSMEISKLNENKKRPTKKTANNNTKQEKKKMEKEKYFFLYIYLLLHICVLVHFEWNEKQYFTDIILVMVMVIADKAAVAKVWMNETCNEAEQKSREKTTSARERERENTEAG